jgi:hypothetical protein
MPLSSMANSPVTRRDLLAENKDQATQQIEIQMDYGCYLRFWRVLIDIVIESILYCTRKAPYGVRASWTISTLCSEIGATSTFSNTRSIPNNGLLAGFTSLQKTDAMFCTPVHSL